MPQIDPSARVAEGARLADGVEVGPFCVVGPQVELRAGVRLLAHVYITGQTVVGERTTIYPFASLGTPAQSILAPKFTQLQIGADCIIREGVTMNTGTGEHAGMTRVGDRGWFMAYSHVGHDCQVGNDVIFANSATLGGHCQVDDFAFLGGLVALHQFTRVGAHALVGGASALSTHLIPFGLANGIPGHLRGINVVGMRRRKLGEETVRNVRAAYKTLFVGNGAFDDRVAAARTQFGADAAVAQILKFIESTPARRLCHPAGDRLEDEDSESP